MPEAHLPIAFAWQSSSSVQVAAALPGCAIPFPQLAQRIKYRGLNNYLDNLSPKTLIILMVKAPILDLQLDLRSALCSKFPNRSSGTVKAA